MSSLELHIVDDNSNTLEVWVLDNGDTSELNEEALDLVYQWAETYGWTPEHLDS